METAVNAPVEAPRAWNLENLRKQAKRLVRQVREHDPETVSRVREHHHRFKSDDTDIASFSLQDAHLVLAREHGFSSWPKLISAAPSDTPTTRQPLKGHTMKTQESLPAQLIALALSKENPTALAVAIGRLEPGLAAVLFESLPEDIQERVIVRMATLADEGPQVIQELEETSTPELKALLLNELVRGVDRRQTVARILRQLSRERETSILQAIRQHDAPLADSIELQRELVTFADMEELTDLEIQLILREIDFRDFAVALKGATDKLTDRIFTNVSEEVGKKMKDEMKFSGPVRIVDVEEIRQRIGKTIRTFEEAG
jgi:flagellar motor switch protein FliG